MVLEESREEVAVGVGRKPVAAFASPAEPFELPDGGIPAGRTWADDGRPVEEISRILVSCAHCPIAVSMMETVIFREESLFVSNLLRLLFAYKF